eukprot:gnl/TRDRNA2_/TRDRNA2_204068_c0_seq1.p1 gnl/TRDRNA2_/TRDRNA2_204068_c0~~gnl/TRDRNA2_/TRDRNA2_204068_c0_seq1.p1  ORF type:complete len:223 (-),score=46.24 gnl/TRDRNA2_/TRDRNA2_204068_c0_seq1:63-731(-)
MAPGVAPNDGFVPLKDANEETPLEQRCWWKVTHALGFVIGGTTFLAGTYLYYLPATTFLGYMSGWLYIIGSMGFLYVDVQEFFTFTEDFWLRVNISCSMIGSTLYVIGSAGFLPDVEDWDPLVGILGFIGGSFFIGMSQLWKCARIQSETGIFSNKDGFTSACVEGGACLGGWGFFFGTILYWRGPQSGPTMQLILTMWMWASGFFTFGGFSLTYRHFVMGV